MQVMGNECWRILVHPCMFVSPCSAELEDSCQILAIEVLEVTFRSKVCKITGP